MSEWMKAATVLTLLSANVLVVGFGEMRWGQLSGISAQASIVSSEIEPNDERATPASEADSSEPVPAPEGRMKGNGEKKEEKKDNAVPVSSRKAVDTNSRDNDGDHEPAPNSVPGEAPPEKSAAASAKPVKQTATGKKASPPAAAHAIEPGHRATVTKSVYERIYK